MEIKEILLRVIKVLIAAVFLTPLILGPFGLNMSEYPKAVFFRFLIEIIFALYVFLVLLNRAYLPKKSILLFSVVLFDAILIIASLFGVDFFRSFFGEMQRGEGIILHLHLLVFFVVLLGMFREKEDWLWLFKTTVIVSALSSVVAVFQQGNVSLFYGLFRPSGTLSNPDLFASYITLSIFLTGFLLFAEKNKKLKILWISLMALNFYALILSGTRGAWVGFAFGIFSIYLLNYKSLSYKKRFFSLLVILFICVAVLVLPFAIGKIHLKNNGFAQRVLEIYSFNLNGRSNLWEISLRAFKDKPILGWGFESFSFVADKYFQTGYQSGTYFDRPHNKLLEVLVNGGIIEMVSYLFIFVALFYLILKYSKKWDGYNNKSGVIFGSIIIAFFVSGFVQNIFGFDHIGTYILFFLAAAFVASTFSDLPEINFEKFDRPLSVVKIITVVLVFIFTGFVMYQINIKPTVAAMYFPEYVRYESSDPATALSGYKNGVSMNTLYDNDLVMAYTDRLIYLLENGYGQKIGDQALSGLLNVRPALYKNLQEKDMRPGNVYELLVRSDEWAYLIKKDPAYLDDMKKDINQAIAFNPTAPVFYQLTGEMEILQNNSAGGEKDIRKSCDMDVIGCKGSETGADKMIGIAYLKEGDYASAVKNFQNALDADYSNREKGLLAFFDNAAGAQFTDSLAKMYYNYLKDFTDCQKVYQRGIEMYPEYKDIFEQNLNMIAASH